MAMPVGMLMTEHRLIERMIALIRKELELLFFPVWNIFMTKNSNPSSKKNRNSIEALSIDYTKKESISLN
jgi:hypothetical protein